MLNVGGDIFFKHLKEKILPTMKHSKHAFCKLNWAIIRYKNYPHTTNSLIGDDDALTLEDTQEDGKDSKTTTTIISRRWLIILIILIKEKIRSKNCPPEIFHSFLLLNRKMMIIAKHHFGCLHKVQLLVACSLTFANIFYLWQIYFD